VASVARQWEGRLAAGMRLLGPRNAAPELTAALDRGGRFLALAALAADAAPELTAALAAVLLGGLAMALAARRFAEDHRRHAALLRCFGARRAQVSGAFALQLLVIGLLAGGVGLALGGLLQFALLALLDTLLGMALPAAGAGPWLLGLGVGLLGLLGWVCAWPSRHGSACGSWTVCPPAASGGRCAPASPGVRGCRWCR